MIRRIILLFALALVGCTGLAGEPRVVSTLVPPTLVPTEPAFPVTMPDLARGAEVYAANCTRCHGLTGAGDGEMVTSGQVMNVASFLDPDTAYPDRPSEWFDIITDGRIENLMPPWRDALSFEDRWSVALYTYSLHHTDAQRARGAELYALECAACHGDSGRGDGPRAAELRDSPGDLADHQGMAFLNDGAIYVSINEGIGDIMPAQGVEYGGTWTDDDIRAVVAHVRSLSTRAKAQDDATPEATAEPGAPATSGPVRVSGTLRNASAGGALPANAAITLFALDPGSDPVQRQFTAVTDANGAFAFEPVTVTADGVLIATLNYRDRVFGSTALRGEALAAAFASGSADLSFPIYELTDDPGVITIAGMVTQVNVIGDGLEIAQVFEIRNTSDRAFTSADMTDDGRPISVALPLPPGALIASFMGDEGRFVVAPDNSAVLDTQMVLPDSTHIVNVVYLVQYGGGAILEQVLPYAFSGAARLLVRPVGMAVSGEQFPSRGIETIGASGEFAAYGGTLDLPAGSVLRYEIGGESAAAGTIDRGLGAVVSGNVFPVVLGAGLMVVALIGGAVFMVARRNRAAAGDDSDAQIDALAGLIADLDGDYAAGNVDAAAYQTQRAALKARMARLIAGKAK